MYDGNKVVFSLFVENFQDSLLFFQRIGIILPLPHSRKIVQPSYILDVPFQDLKNPYLP